MRLNDRQAIDDTKSVVETQLWGAGPVAQTRCGGLGHKIIGQSCDAMLVRIEKELLDPVDSNSQLVIPSPLHHLDTIATGSR